MNPSILLECVQKEPKSISSSEKRQKQTKKKSLRDKGTRYLTLDFCPVALQTQQVTACDPGLFLTTATYEETNREISNCLKFDRGMKSRYRAQSATSGKSRKQSAAPSRNPLALGAGETKISEKRPKFDTNTATLCPQSQLKRLNELEMCYLTRLSPPNTTTSIATKSAKH